MKYILGLLLIVISLISCSATLPTSFNLAKKELVKMHCEHHMYTFYTDTPMICIEGSKLSMENSPYNGIKYVKKGHNIEFDHVVPAKLFKTASTEIEDIWNNGHHECENGRGKGRKCVRKVSQLFNKMESDMCNLVPTIGAINGMKRDKLFVIIKGEKREFGKTIDVEIATNGIEVQENKRGDVARIMLYMVKQYNIKFPNHDNYITMLHEWNENDSIDEWEKKKNDKLKKFGVDCSY